MTLNIAELPSETLVTIAGYLSNEDVRSFGRALRSLHAFTASKSFHRWQRLLGEFTSELDLTFDAIENDRKRQEKAIGPISASSYIFDVPEAQHFEDVCFPEVLYEMKITYSEHGQIQLDDIFTSLKTLGASTGLSSNPLVDCIDAAEGSRILRAALEIVSPLQVVSSLIPLPISQQFEAMPLATADWIILTAYLLFTKLQPEQVLDLLPRYSKLGYVNQQAIAEYFSYLLLFLRVYQFDSALWLDVVRSTKDQSTDRVRWSYANGSPLAAQSLQILRRRIEKWFVNYHEIQTIVSADPNASTLTNEQNLFVNTEIRKAEIFKVRAYAGTGKTKCLVDYAIRRPRKRILYVAYNKQAKLDADFRFRKCNNVDCKTLHSVAFNALSVVNPVVNDQVQGRSTSQVQETGQPSSRRGTFNRIQSAPVDDNFLRNWEIDPIVKALGMTLDNVARVFTTPFEWQDEPSSWNPSFSSSAPTVGNAKSPKNVENLARVVATGITRFCQSRDREPDVSHLSLGQCRTKLCNPELAIDWVKRFWKLIFDGKSTLMTHDCYLKMFSLTENAAADRMTFGKYDIVMFDEAQDANPCMANIILRQRDAAGIIIIGDPYQMIYGFRGAKNECFDDGRLPPTKTFHLTRSFRFGQEVADIANLILGTVGERKPVRGVNTRVPSPAVFLPPLNPHKTVAPSDKHTVIFRSNTELVKYFFSSFAKDPTKATCLRTSAANASSALIPLLRAGYFLYQGNKSKHPRLRGLASFEEAKTYLQREDKSGGMDTDEVDIQAVALIVGMERYYAESKTGDGEFLKMLDSSAACIVDVEAQADVVLTTAHQAKGLEWDDVIVADDFVTHGLDAGNAMDQAWCKEATNLLYVACTRARKRLQLSQGISVFLLKRVGTFRFFVSPEPSNSSCPCCHGKQPFNTFLNEFLVASDNGRGTDTTGYFSSMPSICIGYETLMPRRDPAATNGWTEHTRQPSNPFEIPKCVYLPTVACINCILAWRTLTNKTHGDIFRFAEGLKARLGFSKHLYHSDYDIFWAGRFPPNRANLLSHHGVRRSLVDIYAPGMRMGFEKPQIIGGINENDAAWDEFVFNQARDAGVEYDDEDVDEFIMGFEE
ncbi:hypothetical protein H072_1089 [Dactylellina haptotyla CBS 200.50]|uniref:DNA 3'-5' helicase n=1 Tax=Dactylellina haptotyla (strain CBS 200.50) TaxID=1284197 RepID=S8APQ4_DACHA|nr:hypothetical protein H072_1089 [Dactylellina haptotyla CBS 200.50]